MSKYQILRAVHLCLCLLAPICHSALIGYWSFDEPDVVNGRAIDGSGGKHDAVVSDALPVAGKVGQALSLDGLNSRVDVDGLIVRTPELSVSVWIRKDTVAGVRRLVFFDGLLQFGFDGTSMFVHTFTIHGEDANLPYLKTGIAAGKWYHLAVTWDTVAPADNVKIYIDGDLKAQATLTRARRGKLGITSLTVGATDTPGQDVFDGAVDEVRLYDTALTAEQVEMLSQGKVIEAQPPGESPATGESAVATVKPGDAAFTKLLRSENRAAGKKLLRVASELVSRLLEARSVSEADLPAKVKAWQDTGLDGLIFNVAYHDSAKGPIRAHGQWWNIVPLKYEEFIPEIKAFQAVEDWGRLTDNFLWSSIAVWGSGTCQDWFSDEHWKAVLNNVRIQARVARECGFKGILLDTEQYLHHGRGPWRLPFSYKYYAVTGGYELAGEAEPRSFAECAAKVRERARQYAEAITAEFPDLVLLVIPGLYECALPHGVPRPGDTTPIYKNPQPLYPAFCDGLLLGLDERAAIVAATESTYGKTLYKDMLVARDACKERSVRLSTVPELARRRISFAAGVWAEAGRRWSDTDVSVNQRDPETHKHALHSALAASDRYAWLYGEKSKFLSTAPTPLMREYFQANIEAHQAQDLFWEPKGKQ